MTLAATPVRLRPSPGAPTGARGPFGQRCPRPVLVRLYAAVLGDGGVAGAPARRRARRFVLRSLPAAVTVLVAALVALRAFEAPAPGWPQAAAMAALAAALGGVVWRRVAGAAAGRGAGHREQLELGALMIVAAYAVSRSAAGGDAESPFQAVVYLVMAFLVAFLARGVGFALVVLAVALEALLWISRGARPWDAPGAVVHAGFIVLFAVLYHAVLSAQVASGRRSEAAAVERRMREIAERAQELRLLGPSAAEGDPAERERRWTEAAVVEIEAAVRGALEVAEVALRSHTCAVFLLSPDDRELRLRECRSSSDAVSRAPLPAGEGALGGAVRRRSPVRLHGEVRSVSYYADGTRPRALLAVPLVDRRGDHVRGVVVADRLDPAPFTDEDERLLRTLSGEILRAVEAERLMMDMKRTRDEKERFYEAIERLNRTTKPLEVFDATLEVARGMVAVDFGAVTLAEERDGRTVHRVARVLGAEDGLSSGAKAREGKPTAVLEGLEFKGDTGLVASAVRLGSSLPAKEIDVAKAPVFDSATRLRGLASLKVIPLRTAQEVLGAVVLGARRAGAYGPEAVRQLEVVAMQAAESIYRARLFEQTERLATTDGLTGLLNHRTFQGRLDEHVAHAQRYAKRLSLILCDIDHFKSVNDTYGHPVGDLVLKAVARTLAREARATDLVARYGGEEFAVVMPETDAAGALVIAERIRERIAELALDTDQGRLQVTMSLGVATLPDDGGRKGALVERADACLYHAKRSGRNRTVAAGAQKPPARAAG
ncbi:MAG TPA: diguanylate cyclase [Anaeromyxobacter sp.]|nr:diguanylate cyclase [Anaeromyxobacter sp.]